MSRRAWVVAAMLAGVAFAGLPLRAPATPFADVPADHWAYQAIASLSADGLIDGYPDGSFNGDRPLTRYEMATIVARIVAKLEADGAGAASKTDLDALQKLIDALKDELDALGVRVTTVEDAVAALDRRTHAAQALAIHGTILADGSFRAVPGLPHSVVNATGVVQTPYDAPAPVPNGAFTGIDPFVSAYETSPDDNDPLEQQIGPQTILRSDARFDFVYTVDDNVTVTVPVHVVDNGWSSANAPQFAISPDVVVDVAAAGAFTNLTLREAQLDNLASSRVGLTYRAPDAAEQIDFQNATQPFPRGFEIGGVIAGLTSFQLTFSQVDQTLINTQSYLPGAGNGFANTYFSEIVPPQTGLVQLGNAQTTDTFSSGSGSLAGVYLSKKAVAGTVAIVAYATPAGPAAPPPFSYLDGTNEVVFAQPLPPGSHITITYVGLGYTNNEIAQRYQMGLRVNTLIAGLPGAEIGLTYHRLWDEDLPAGTGAAAVDLGVNAAPPGGTGFGPVSDEVFGLDFQVPLAIGHAGASTPPLLFGEAAGSQYTPDRQFVAVTGATAAVVGLKLTFHNTQATLQLQRVGANYLDGAPLRFFGNAPPTWANYQGDFFPQFFGFANTLGVNAAFDASIDAAAPGHSATAANPALTFIYPVFNPFVAGGPDYYSAFAPNTVGPSLTVLGPLRFGGLTVMGRLFAQHLAQLQADAGSTATFGPQFPTAVRATFDKLDAGGTFPVAAFGKTVDVNLAGTLEHLRRNDTTGYLYVPYNPANAGYDPGALANFEAAGGTVDAGGKILGAGSSAVLFYPNEIDLRHTVVAAGASLPVSPDVVFRTRFSDQRYTGSYGTTIQQNIDGTKDQVDLGLTYTVPKTSSSVGLTFRNSTYRDGTLSSYNLNENREDVNFTIRF
jgi:hypothetical protein